MRGNARAINRPFKISGSVSQFMAAEAEWLVALRPLQKGLQKGGDIAGGTASIPFK